jgi:hypothetical protein
LAATERSDHSWDVIQRLDMLKTIQKHFEDKEDKYDQLPNVKAIIHAYRSKKLDWIPGLVTYWSHGTQLCEPRPHDWVECNALNDKYDGTKSFWVEGVSLYHVGSEAIKSKRKIADL